MDLVIDLIDAATQAIATPGSENLVLNTRKMIRLVNRACRYELIDLAGAARILTRWNRLKEAIEVCKPASVTYDERLGNLKGELERTFNIRLTERIAV